MLCARIEIIGPTCHRPTDVGQETVLESYYVGGRLDRERWPIRRFGHCGQDRMLRQLFWLESSCALPSRGPSHTTWAIAAAGTRNPNSGKIQRRSVYGLPEHGSTLPCLHLLGERSNRGDHPRTSGTHSELELCAGTASVSIRRVWRLRGERDRFFSSLRRCTRP